ncbi:DUF2716 domain-containing protein [Streptomyces griseus]|uniref:DUF2716 domain-containing protein n=2 Tax=Streptomyces griseus TaxID=1911 RepID=UPI00386CC233
MMESPVVELLDAEYRRVGDRFAPQGVGASGQSAWPLSPYPDGDCYIYLSEDFRTGSSGTPGKSLRVCSVRNSSTPRPRRSRCFSAGRSVGPGGRSAPPEWVQTSQGTQVASPHSAP